MRAVTVAGALLGLSLAWAHTAHASLILTLSDTNGIIVTKTVSDPATGGLANVRITGTADGLTYDLSTGTGDRGTTFVSLNSTFNNNTNASLSNPFVISLISDRIDPLQAQLVTFAASSAVDVGNTTAVAQGFFDPTNSDVAGAGTQIGLVNLGPGAPTTGSNDFAEPAVTSVFSESEVVTITFANAGQFGFTSSITPVPEPASIALLGTGLFAMGALIRRRRRT